MPLQYDLTKEPWIPMRMLGNPQSGMAGLISQVGLYDALKRAHEIEEIVTGSPLETISIYRLLLALAIHIFSESIEESSWMDMWNAKQLDEDRIKAYFNDPKRRDRFDLLHPEYPFYQHPSPREAGLSTIARLFNEAASGNNPTLFSHEVDGIPPRVPLDAAGRAIVAIQAYGVAGTAGPKLPSFYHGPLIGKAIFWIRGNSLFEALMLNAPPDPKARFGGAKKNDVPAWERGVVTSSARIPEGYLDYLTWQCREIKLEVAEDEDGGLVAIGIRVRQGDKLDEIVADEPMAAYVGSQTKGTFPYNFRKERALWRDSATFIRPYQGAQVGHAPFTLDWVANNIYDFSPEERTRFSIEVDVFGMVNDKAKLELWRHERTPVYPIYLTDSNRREALDKALNYAESQSRNSLRTACQAFARYLLLPGHKTDEVDNSGRFKNALKQAEVDALVESLGAERRFWSRLEPEFFSLLKQLAGLDDHNAFLSMWRRRVRQHIENAYREATESLGSTARVLRAFTAGELALRPQFSKEEAHT